MKTVKEIEVILRNSYGAACYHAYSLFDSYPVITDGVKNVADAAECYWFLDIIGSYQKDKNLNKWFQVWKLTKREDESCIVEGSNDRKLIITQEVPYTDFPMKELVLWLENGVILLPSEH